MLDHVARDCVVVTGQLIFGQGISRRVLFVCLYLSRELPWVCLDQIDAGLMKFVAFAFGAGGADQPRMSFGTFQRCGTGLRRGGWFGRLCRFGFCRWRFYCSFSGGTLAGMFRFFLW